jgi:hypothetical protein
MTNGQIHTRTLILKPVAEVGMGMLCLCAEQNVNDRFTSNQYAKKKYVRPGYS